MQIAFAVRVTDVCNYFYTLQLSERYTYKALAGARKTVKSWVVKYRKIPLPPILVITRKIRSLFQ